MGDYLAAIAEGVLIGGAGTALALWLLFRVLAAVWYVLEAFGKAMDWPPPRPPPQ